MKKKLASILSIVLVLGLLLSLTGCGDSAKKQEAIDAFNTTSAAFNEVGAIINENAAQIDADTISDCQQMAELLGRYQGFLESDEEYSDEQYDQMIEWFGTVQDWSADMKTQLEDFFG